MPASSSYLNQPLRSLADATRQRQENPMNKPAHTSEPWHASSTRYGNPGASVKDRHGQVVADCHTFDQSIAQREANARRIVACVNACAGIPTEALESGAIASLMAAAKYATRPQDVALLARALATLRVKEG